MLTIEKIKKELDRAFGKYTFIEDGHYYLCSGKQVNISVTKFISNFENEFERDKIAEMVANKENKSIDEVLDEWQYKADFACTKGTTCHEFAQSLWSGEEWNLLFFKDDKEYLKAVDKIKLQAIKFKNDYSDILEHIQDEQLIGSEEYDIASAVDHLFYNKLTGGIVLADYKTNTILKGYNDDEKKRKYTKNMRIPLSNIKDDALHHYYLQLSIYKYIIEKYTNLKIDEMFIVYMSENNDNYEIINIDYLENEVKKILENRRVKNMKPVIIMGGSGTGKSFSFRNLPAEETAIISVAKTELPFRNKNKLKFVQCEDYEQIKKAIENTKKRIIIIDDASFLTQFETLKKAFQGSEYGKKENGIAKNFYELLQTTRKDTKDEKIIYLTMHERKNDSGIIAPKTCGNSVDDRINVEGQVNILFRSLNKDGEYVFQTHNDGTSVCKTPYEMFSEDFITNDLLEIDKIIREYYDFKPITEKLDKVEEIKKEEEEK